MLTVETYANEGYRTRSQEKGSYSLARRRKSDVAPARFTTGEVAKATGLPVRSVIYLCEKGLLPSEGGGSRSGHRELRIEGLVRAALAGALYSSGIDVAKAAVLVEAIAEDEDVGVKIAYAGLDRLLRDHFGVEKKSPAAVPANAPWGDEPFHWHELLKDSPVYVRNKGLVHDHILQILNGTFGTLTHLEKVGERYSPAETFALLFRIENLEKGAKDLIVKKTSVSPLERMKWEQAASVMTINLSLAARNAFDAIADLRAAS